MTVFWLGERGQPGLDTSFRSSLKTRACTLKENLLSIFSSFIKGQSGDRGQPGRKGEIGETVSMTCNLWFATYGLQPMVCNLWFATYDLQPEFELQCNLKIVIGVKNIKSYQRLLFMFVQFVYIYMFYARLIWPTEFVLNRCDTINISTKLQLRPKMSFRSKSFFQ